MSLGLRDSAVIPLRTHSAPPSLSPQECLVPVDCGGHGGEGRKLPPRNPGRQAREDRNMGKLRVTQK